VAPESSCPAGEDPASFWCSTSMVLASSLLAVLIAAACSAPVWLLLSKRFGKHRVWLSFNLLNAVTNLGFIACGRGATRTTVIVAALNGLPLGAKFLSEAVLADIVDYGMRTRASRVAYAIRVADIVDYDEFLSGRRSEGNYTVFKSLLPKMIGIPTSAVPLALMNALGFVPSVDGVSQTQPEAVVAFLRVTFVVVPVFFALASFTIKMRYPLSDPVTIRQISAGIGAHLHGQGFIDPISKKLVEHWQPQGRDEWQVWLLESFPTVAAMQTLLSPNGAFPLKRAMARHLRTSIVCLLVALAVATATMPLLEQPQFSVVPVLATIGVGTGVGLVVFFSMRLNAARALVRYGYDPELVQVMLAKRTGLSMDEYNSRFRTAHRDPAIATEDGNRESISLLRDELRVLSGKMAALALDYEGRIGRIEAHLQHRGGAAGPSGGAGVLGSPRLSRGLELAAVRIAAAEEAASLLGPPSADDDSHIDERRASFASACPLPARPRALRAPHRGDGSGEHDVPDGPLSAPIEREQPGVHARTRRSWSSGIPLSLVGTAGGAADGPARSARPSSSPLELAPPPVSLSTIAASHRDQTSYESDSLRV